MAQIVGNPAPDNNENINPDLQIEPLSNNGFPVRQCTELNMEPINVVYGREPAHVVDFARLQNLEAVVEEGTEKVKTSENDKTV